MVEISDHTSLSEYNRSMVAFHSHLTLRLTYAINHAEKTGEIRTQVAARDAQRVCKQG